MKRTWFAAALLLCLLALCIGVSLKIQKNVRSTASLLQNAEESARSNDFATAEKYCREALEYWSMQSGTMAAFLRHDEPDEVEIGLSQLITYSETQDIDEFLAVCIEVRLHLDHIREMEQPKFKNIL